MILRLKATLKAREGNKATTFLQGKTFNSDNTDIPHSVLREYKTNSGIVERLDGGGEETPHAVDLPDTPVPTAEQIAEAEAKKEVEAKKEAEAEAKAKKAEAEAKAKKAGTKRASTKPKRKKLGTKGK